MNAFKTTLEKHANGMHYIAIPSTIGDKFKAENVKRVRCIVNDMVNVQAAIRHDKAAGYCVYIGKRYLSKLKIRLKATLNIQIKADDSQYGVDMPETLEAVLQTDEEALLLFEQLTDGKKRSAIFMITRVKSRDAQIRRALKIVGKWKLGEFNPQKWLRKD